MVSDRASDALIFMVLAILYPTYSLLFVLCFILDFGSHWLQFQSSARSQKHHKENENKNFIVAMYYNNKPFFMWLCVGAELACLSLYVAATYKPLEGDFTF